jgi:heme exporter protein D
MLNMGGYAVVYVFLFLHLPITLAFLVMLFMILLGVSRYLKI